MNLNISERSQATVFLAQPGHISQCLQLPVWKRVPPAWVCNKLPAGDWRNPRVSLRDLAADDDSSNSLQKSSQEPRLCRATATTGRVWKERDYQYWRKGGVGSFTADQLLSLPTVLVLSTSPLSLLLLLSQPDFSADSWHTSTSPSTAAIYPLNFGCWRASDDKYTTKGNANLKNTVPYVFCSKTSTLI